MIGDHPADECVPMLMHEDTCKRLRGLYDAALEARRYVVDETHDRRNVGAHGAADLTDAILERLDAALADAQEVLT